MNNDKLHRYREQQQKLKDLKQQPRLELAASSELVQGFLQSEVNEQRFLEQQQRLEEFYQIPEMVFDTHEEGQRLLSAIRDQVQREMIDSLLHSCQETVSQTILTRFGLTMEMFDDRIGGNVQTVHNAKKGIYASRDTEYDDKAYKYQKARKIYLRKRGQVDGTFLDQYTGKPLEASRVNLDHIIARKTHHDQGGFMQSNAQKSAYAQDERNFAITDSSLNQSKQDLDMTTFQSKTVKGHDQNNKDRFNMDNRRVKPAIRRAEKALKDHLPSKIEKATYYTKESVKHGLRDGMKMGVKQVVGLILHELTAAFVVEVKDVCRVGFRNKVSGQSIMSALKERLVRVGERILTRWKDLLHAFGNGVLDGILSNLLTTLVNLFYTTSERAIRMIRGGARSLWSALSMLLAPPEGMTQKQAAHEATKQLASGLVIAGGVILEEVVEKWISALVAPLPLLIPLVGAIVTVIVGIITGLTTVSVFYFLDKIDLFGVNADSEHEQITAQLQSIIDESLDDAKNRAWRMGLLK